MYYVVLLPGIEGHIARHGPVALQGLASASLSPSMQSFPPHASEAREGAAQEYVTVSSTTWVPPPGSILASSFSTEEERMRSLTSPRACLVRLRQSLEGRDHDVYSGSSRGGLG